MSDYMLFGKEESESESDPEAEPTTTEDNPWDWGVVVTPSGEIIEPGACDDYHYDDAGSYSFGGCK